MPAFARGAFNRPGGVDNESLRQSATPQMMWNYSMFHVASHFHTHERLHRFMIKTEDDTAAILLEITHLRSCPADMGHDTLPASKFFDPEDKESLGQPPIFAVRYFYEKRMMGSKWRPSNVSTSFLRSSAHNGGLMEVTAASLEEIEFARQELERGTAMLGKTAREGKFNESLLYPVLITKTKEAGKAGYICAYCSASVSQRLCCSQCKVTFYCGRDCQVKHWKDHKRVCCKATETPGTGDRKSFTFDIEDASLDSVGGPYGLFVNRFGNVSLSGPSEEEGKQARKDLRKQHKGANISKVPDARNVHSDSEFIVKLQPPAKTPTNPGLRQSNPWMCYDGPTRSFQAHIPSTTTGLDEVYALLQRETRPLQGMVPGVIGYKGYFKARWEGSTVRVYYDRVLPFPGW